MSERLSLLYLHGFLSSPASSKAVLTRDYVAGQQLAQTVLIPELKSGPAQTLSQLEALLQGQELDKVALIGSSLGGFYATVLAEKFGLPAVLINPAVGPQDYWKNYLGEHHNYHSGELFEVTIEHVDQLRSLDPPEIEEPEKYRVYVQKHDEVLDYRRALERYGEQQCIIREDGDHAYANFAVELPQSFDFLLSRIGQFVR